MFDRGVRSLVHQPGLSADLDSFDLLDLVQAIHLARRDLSLVVRAGSQSLGILRFSQGDLLWAEFGELRGEEAFRELAAQHAGSIEQLPWDGHGERNVNQPLSRLIMQAVGYRDARAAPQAQRIQEGEGQGQPGQPKGSVPPSPAVRERLNGSDSQPRPGNGVLQAPKVLLPEDESVPMWVREIHSATEAFSAQPTNAMPPLSPAALNGGVSPALSIDPTPSSASLLEELDAQIPQPTVPLSALNGRLLLPSLTNGNRANSQAGAATDDEPPTVPLPTVSGGLLDYAPKRARQLQEPLRDAAPRSQPTLDPLPEQAVTIRSQSMTDNPAPSPSPTSAPTLASAQPAPPGPSGEPKPSSLSILEQLAYGGQPGNGSAEAAMSGAIYVASAAPIEAPDAAVLAPAREPELSQRIPSRLLDGVAGRENGRLSHESALDPIAAAARVAPPLTGSMAAPAPAALPVGTLRYVRQALEMFAGQVGAACIATAVIRADGALLADYQARSSQEQELSSPAYHLAHVMQSSLRALLMGGWGDLEDTIITGSTHSVMLRRLGRAEKGLFHVAVLERSGNPGLCRVRMRNSEAALLQNL